MTKTHEIRIGIFDINGTIQDKDGVSLEVREAFVAMGRGGLRTTIATGRGVSRAKELLGDTLDTVVSPGMPISVENGGRLATIGGDNIRYHELDSDVRVSTLDVLSEARDDIEFAAYYPRDTRRGISLWTPSGEVPLSFTQRHGVPGEVHTDSITELDRRVEKDEACMLIVKPRDITLADAFQDANVELNEGELNILNAGVNKGRGVLDIAEYTDTPLDQVMVAGNDHNDRPMFELPVARKLFVGDNEVTVAQGQLIHFTTPALLGGYLKKLGSEGQR